MNCILCIDNSGSTAGCEKYWDKVSKIYKEAKPYRLIYWSDTAEERENFEVFIMGGTEPQSFIPLLQNETKPFNLIITTDGEISQDDIDACSVLVTPQLLSLINSTVIHYIGYEDSMNIGLNIIFGGTNKLSYYINENDFTPILEKFDEVEMSNFMSPNFIISLIVRIKNIEATYPDESARKAHLAELRGEVTRLFSKLQNESLDLTVDEQLEKYYENNQYQEFVDLLKEDRKDVLPFSQQKVKVLNLFDRNIDLNIGRISSAATVPEQVIETPEESAAWSEFEDSITMDEFKLPCLLVQNPDGEPLITNNTLLKHPFSLLSEPDIIKEVMLLIEPNLIDYTTYKKLNFDGRGFTVSPYTRVKCKGVFVLECDTMKRVKSNCRTMSVLFGKDNKVPGNLIMWNLVILYLLYKYKFNDDSCKTVIFDQIMSYCKEFKTTLSFSHQCQLPRRARIEICLWFAVQAAPRVCPNTAMNILRAPFGLGLLYFYLDTFGRVQDEYLTELSQRTKKWAVWHYFLVNRGKRDLNLEVKAQYQNYCVHNDQIILRPGKCETPYRSKCNILDADWVNTLFVNVARLSKKIDDIDKFELQPVSADNADSDEGIDASSGKKISDALSHVKINVETCWPFVICPVSKVHWKECVGEYNLKTESYVRIFNKYCRKYKQYPVHYMDLVLFYSRRAKNPVVKQCDFNNYEYVYSLFDDVRRKYTCEEYLNVYNNHTDEKVRLSKE